MVYRGHFRRSAEKHLLGSSGNLCICRAIGVVQMPSRIKAQLDVGHKHTVTWKVEDDHEFMREAGDNFIALLGLPLVFRDVDEETAQVQNDKLAVALARLLDHQDQDLSH